MKAGVYITLSIVAAFAMNVVLWTFLDETAAFRVASCFLVFLLSLRVFQLTEKLHDVVAKLNAITEKLPKQ